MIGFVNITYEGKHTVNEIQKRFREQLPEKEILKTTARALNETAKKVQGHIRQQIRGEYTVKNKYLMEKGYSKMSDIMKYASGVHSGLYANVGFSYRTIPMIAFQHTGMRNSDRPITVTIKRGSKLRLRHAWIGLRRKASKYKPEIEAIYSFGEYAKKFIPNLHARKGDYSQKASELNSSSPFTMMSTNTMRGKIITYIDKTLPSRLQYFLQKKLDNMNK